MSPKRATGIGAAIVAVSLLVWSFLPGDAVEVTLPPGVSAGAAGHILKRAGVVRSALLFKAAARWSGADRKMKPGTFKLRRNMSLTSLLKALESGSEALGIRVPIPEGFSAQQISERLEASGVCMAAAFLKHAADHRLEGYLFPTTYFFEPNTPPEKVAARMTAEFQKRVAPEYEKASPKPKLTLHQAMTLASIVEREAVLSQERPMIAAVYLNRLKKRMRLEADPTVQYALGYWKKGLTYAELRNPSPYNTYVHYGLPPGPICSFSLESFLAVLSPAPTDAIYFVADNTGGHVFSATHDEHLKAKQSFKRGLRAIKERLKREEVERKKAGLR